MKIYWTRKRIPELSALPPSLRKKNFTDAYNAASSHIEYWIGAGVSFISMMILSRVYDFLFTRPRYFPGWYHQKFMCCVSIHINLVSVFGICHEEILQTYSGARKRNRNHFRKVDTWGWYTRIWTMASGPSLFLHCFPHCSIRLHSFTDNNYKIKVMAVLIQENKRSFYGYLFLLYRRILNDK